ncbi:hypothetical protein PVT68_01420 [Microbulbifer bruguierae]|uniref:Uncharacterized protein n=1 Tax=Microbulbifer bruguierae TaxID=3029061 RepID=A0ABY8NDH6_9GAMM|nr:hypothetical protein [Microbulbifer bruguierae]WGL16973.1 hypothetical protein PVT68_01420 [Microbulbifer bruguierae]
MIRKLLRKWDGLQFDAMIKQRVETAKWSLDKHGQPTERDIDVICTRFAKEIVLRNLKKEDPSQVELIKKKIQDARIGIQKMFMEDGHSHEFSNVLSYICVGWDWDAYKDRNLKHNLTMNYLLKKHTFAGAFFKESMLFDKSS